MTGVQTCALPILDQVLEATLGFGPKYSAKRKLPAIETLMPRFGPHPLSKVVKGVRRKGSAADVHLLVTGFHYDRERACYFRSSEVARADPGWGFGGASDDVTLAQAIHASTNAPVMFFDGPATFTDKPGKRFWDGAIAGNNNPVLVAVAEAISLGAKPTDIAVLSLGTGTVVLPWSPDAPQQIGRAHV